MKLKLSLAAPGGDRDVLVTVDGTASVGDVAEEVARCVPEACVALAEGGRATLQVRGLPSQYATDESTILDPDVPVVDAPLRSGTRVEISRAPGTSSRALARRADAVAVLTVVRGPGAGSELPLRAGQTVIGRDQSLSDVVFDDGYVSKRHVRLSITDVVEVVDLGSANGTVISGRQVQRAVIRPHDNVSIGNTVFTVRPLAQLTGDRGPTLEFNRPPVVLQVFGDGEVDGPELPGKPRPHPFPVLSLVVPVMMVATLFLVMRFSTMGRFPLFSLVFLGMAPLMILGSFLDQRRNISRQEKEEERRFAQELVELRVELAKRRKVERESRLLEAPSTEDGIHASESTSPQLWSRRPDRPFFLDVRLGLGAMPSRTVLKMPDRRRAKPEHWHQLVEVRDEFAVVDDVPVVASLTRAGGIGIAGPANVMHSVARSLVVQAAALHSPAELAIAAMGGSESLHEWDWLKWLPHVASSHSPLGDCSLAGNAVAAERLVAELEELVEQRRPEGRSNDQGPVLPGVLVVVLNDSPIDRSRLVQLAEAGRESGVHVLWCATEYAQIPAACRAFVQFDDSMRGWSGQVHLDEIVSPITCEAVTAQVATHVARRMAPIVDSSARIDDESDLPTSLSLLAESAYGPSFAAGTGELIERWVANDPTLVGQPLKKGGISLRALVGQGATDAFALDLALHGPHALVGGTTGAGKSEFLQTWVLSMAASNSPKRLTFLFVDYKGGAAFARCTDLPHCVGLITDLDQHLVRRALESLRAELVHREHVLNRFKAKDISDLDRTPNAEILPRLIIVVDEFAALVSDVPEFIDGVVDIAQRGRSLGIHLILATQQPSGVIRGSLRANTNLRVALRMADAADSTDVIGDALAAGFDPSVPGRAAAKTGPGRITVFQSLYAGGVTTDEPPAPEMQLETLGFGELERLVPVVDEGGEAAEASRASAIDEAEPSDLSRVVDRVIEAHQELRLEEPRKPWLPVLAPTYRFEKVPQRTDAALAIGIQDVPQEQRDRYVFFNPDEDGNMSVLGTGASGKSTVLRTLAVAAAGTMRGGPCDVYCIDMGSGGLAMLEPLPHVGAVITGTDHERVGRLLRWLRDEVDVRSTKFAEAKAANITEYRSRTGDRDARRILVLLDGYSAFQKEYDLGPRFASYALFGQLAADGRAVGIHFVITADRPGAIPTSLSATIQRSLVLRLASPDDYSFANVPRDVLNADSPPGRGVIDGLEVQVAVLGGSSSLPKQSDKIGQLADALDARGRAPAMPIRRLPDRVELDELPVQGEDGRIPIGVESESLAPFSIEPTGSYVVVGPPGSGRTSTVACIASSLRRAYPQAPCFLFGVPRTSLRHVVEWTEVAAAMDEYEELAEQLREAIEERRLEPEFGAPVLIVIEGVDRLAGELVESALEKLSKVALTNDVLVVAESEISALGQAYTLGPTLKQARRGFALQPDSMDGDVVFKTGFPRVSRGDFPLGRGMSVERGQARLVQVAMTD